MLLTITNTREPATDLGYLLHKNPARVQSFELAFGKVHVFYPEATQTRCTVALLLDFDPVGLVRNRRGPAGETGVLQQYVNDRPYVASSFLSVAIARVFASAIGGTSKDRPELVNEPLPLVAKVAVIPCRGGEDLLRRLFEPLGYTVRAEHHPLDELFPEWGEGPYYTVEIEQIITLKDLLTHLYVLIPVLDAEKHYWVSQDEVEKLLRRGEGWLQAHPECELIVNRYLRYQKRLASEALARLIGEEEPDPEAEEQQKTEQEAAIEKPLLLNDIRLQSVVEALKQTGAARVIDLGCGEGKLIRELLKHKQFQEIVGMDVSYRSLEIANERLHLDTMAPKQKERIRLFQGSLMYRDAERICQERNRIRPDRDFGPHVIRNQAQQMRRSLRGLEREGFRHVHIFEKPEDLEGLVIERQPLWNNLKHEHGPFDIIGDVHGCFDELIALFQQLGYSVQQSGTDFLVTPPDGRKAIFVGDLVDRRPKIPETLRLAMAMANDGTALCVPGNHDMKLLRKLRGKDVQITHGLADTLAQLEPEPPEFKREVAEFIDDMVSHYVFDDGKLVVAHAGMKEEMQGRGSGAVRSFALFGETTGETDDFGLPVRYNWAADYRGRAMVVYGHTPVAESEWLNRTINIDTGCVFGGKLTALRYPEKELVSVPALRQYYAPAKPFLPQEPEAAVPLTHQQELDDLLDIDDVIGKRIVETRLHGNLTIREENAIAALEVMSRFATNPKWLIYLPPTMSPSETTEHPGLLEHPTEAFGYFRKEHVDRVICEQKHMGSRAVVIVCRDRETAIRRFGIVEDQLGVCYTRTGRRFFNDDLLERGFLERIRQSVEKTALWEELRTDWLCLDCELMPWSAKAQELLRQQYAPTGAAARAGLRQAVAALTLAAERQPEAEPLLGWYQERGEMAGKYVEAYRRYCWPVHALADLKVAPFHLLASEGAVHADKDHVWHMQLAARLAGADPELVLATPFKLVDLHQDGTQAEGIAWWEELTAAGGEGMVVKPVDFVGRSRRGLIQPAIKCRGPEYLRIIYGPEYTAPQHLERLRARGLSTKRSLALREFALGIEALQRFVDREPLRRVHECVFGVLALESEPVDPRL